MIRSLRKKFILFAMAAVTVLLLVIGLAANGLARYMFERQLDEVMYMLEESEGMFMQREPRNTDKPLPPPPPKRDLMRSIRFFTVLVDPSGAPVSSRMDQIMYLDEDEALSLAGRVLSGGRSAGIVDRYKYSVKEKDGEKLIIFLDMTREKLTIRTLLISSAVIGVASWLIVLLFVIFLSGKVVKPITAGMEKQKQFITNAGHELKTPLAIIQSNNDAMCLIHGENKYNRNIKEQVTRLSELTSNLLVQARLDEEAELKREKINISEIAENILRSYEENAKSCGIMIVSGILPNIFFSTNRESFIQLMTILMDNASKYTPDGGRICLDLSSDQKHILLIEENDYDHDPVEDPERLFDRFYRGDAARTQENLQSGYGIGLSVARSICESLGGKLTASYPEPGRIRFTAKL